MNRRRVAAVVMSVQSLGSSLPCREDLVHAYQYAAAGTSRHGQAKSSQPVAPITLELELHSRRCLLAWSPEFKRQLANRLQYRTGVFISGAW